LIARVEFLEQEVENVYIAIFLFRPVCLFAAYNCYTITALDFIPAKHLEKQHNE
jgi:hypothetical protein